MFHGLGICFLTANLLFPAGAAPEPEQPKPQVFRFEIKLGDELDPFLENAYLVVNPVTRQALLIDPGGSDAAIDQCLSEQALKLVAILNTHGHADHVGGDAHYAQAFHVKVYAHALDRPLFKAPPAFMKFLPKEGKLSLAGLAVRVIHLPGHTPGSVAYALDGVLFTGDTLFKGTVGITPGTSRAARERLTRQESEGIKAKLLPLPPETVVYPGHGEPTTLQAEAEGNPWLNQKLPAHQNRSDR